MQDMILYILLALVFGLFICVILIISSNKGLNREVNALTKAYQKLSDDADKDNKQGELINNSLLSLGKMLSENQEKQARAMDNELKSQRQGMNEQLEFMSNRMEAIYKNIGEMNKLATGVDDLKKVLSNVKTRGILGEAQLGLILEQILSPEQYSTNVEVIPETGKRVEYAVKFPGDGNRPVWLPIDSKFPGETYGRYRDVYESGNVDMINASWKELELTLKSEARDIHDKYIEVPFTTDFGIMFLPFEGLYSEAVNHNMVEVLQRDYKVTIAGPTTMAVLLNSFQMGFRTLAIEKHSSEVWELLGAVKTEFGKYKDALYDAHEQVKKADKKLEVLSTTRTNAVERKLRSVDALENGKSLEVLELDEYINE